jgi:exopolyphosphatase/guanosine-5'-triphosphate,3'-diphosphate pyrophosphatase
MDEGEAPVVRRSGAASARVAGREVFAAIDLGTNNCRLLIAEPTRAGFRVVDGFSRIVRLGEGLAASGALTTIAMRRTRDALAVCADRIAERGASRVRCVATQACRTAANGATFLAGIRDELGLAFEVIAPEEEARLAMIGCAALIDPAAAAALVVDIGGGSTEFTFIDADCAADPLHAAPLAWASLPFGVVTLAERVAHGESLAGLTAEVRDAVAGVAAPDWVRAAFDRGDAHMIGASGTVTSLAGVHLDLPRYLRSRVDGLWMDATAAEAAAAHLAAIGHHERAAHPCIGPDRADLVLPGSAILQAILDVWPSRRIRVADRGLREGLLMTMMAGARRDGRRT